MDEADIEEVIALSERLSGVCAGQKIEVALQALLNVCAMGIVNACKTGEEANRSADKAAKRLPKVVQQYWRSAHPH